MNVFGSEGIKITPSFAAAPLTLEAFRKSFEPDDATLRIDSQTQASSLWCYAACASMAIQFINKTDQPAQCRIAGFVTNGHDDDPDHCCTTTFIDPPCVSRGCTIDEVGSIYHHFGVTFTGSGNPQNGVLGQVDFATLQAEFQANRPVELVLQWDFQGGSGKHALLVTGVRDQQQLFVLDPLDDHHYEGWCTIESLKRAFGHGEWIKTWPGLKPTP